jgi:hypothetical protein
MKNQQHAVLPSDAKKCTCNPEAHNNAVAECCGDKTRKSHAMKDSKSSTGCCGGHAGHSHDEPREHQPTVHINW